MSNQISRMYGSRAQADAAVAELKEEGYTDIQVVSVSDGGESGPSVAEIAGWIASGRILMSDAKIYAEGVKKGGTLVTVFAPWGTGAEATRILESYQTIPSGMPEPEPERYWDEATPVSCAFHMPVLMDDATPVSKIIGFPPLTKADWSFSSLFGMSLLSSNPPGESRWGMKFLSNNPSPLSSMLGMPLLTKDRKARSW